MAQHNARRVLRMIKPLALKIGIRKIVPKIDIHSAQLTVAQQPLNIGKKEARMSRMASFEDALTVQVTNLLVKVARTYLLARWLYFLMTLFRSKDFTDFYGFWLPK